jgi:hypothetical protein
MHIYQHLSLSGSTRHYRSILEFLPHAFWLQQDPSLKCSCKHCHETLPGLSLQKGHIATSTSSSITTEAHTDSTKQSPATNQSYCTDASRDNLTLIDDLGEIDELDGLQTESQEVEDLLLDVNASASAME